MSGSDHLVVGIHVDALPLATPRMVVSGGPDHSRLPFFDGRRDVNGDVPFLTSAISPRPFEDLDVELGPGVHLHWTLPAALREGVHDAAGVTFPAVPNRWLVTRTAPGAADAAWVVESDYLHPEANLARPGAVTVPVVPDPAAGRHQPFRHLGRTVTLHSWVPLDATAQYLDRLTAVGAGDPGFAAFYPSCRGVFGFHDPDPPAVAARYAVLGCYADPAQDLLRSFRIRLAGELGRAPNADELTRALADRLHLGIDRPVPGGVPDGLLLVGAAEVAAPGGREVALPRFPDVTVAPSAVEAAAARVARASAAFTGARPDRVEEQLDLACLGSALDPRHVDVGFAFHEQCHARSFGPVPAGTLWRLLPDPQLSDPEQASASTGTPPPAVALALDRLNGQQRRLDDTDAELASIGDQLFVDWQKWMHSRSGTVTAAAPDADRIMDFVERRDLAEHAAGRTVRNRLDRAVVGAVSGIRRALRGTGLVLEPTAAQRYAVPAEPYVLFEGPAVAHSGRFGRPAPGTVSSCPVVTVSDRHPVALRAAVAALGERVPAPPDGGVDWHPVLFDWEVEFLPLVEHADAGTDGSDYSPDFLTHNYRYGPDDVELRLVPGRATGPADIVSGRSLLTRGARTQLLDALERFVWTRLVQDGHWAPAGPPPESERVAYLSDLDVLQRLLDHYLARAAPTGIADDLMVAVLTSYAIARRSATMGHVLGGFDAALLMRRATPQLPVVDPLGFRDQAAFTERVRDAVGPQRTHAAIPEGRFHPLRAGDLSILRLRIVDRFGRHISYDRDDAGTRVDVAVSRRLERRAGEPLRIHLPARLAQPARIGASWLAAEHDLVEVSDHPATSPICGWFVADHLDRSLLVYDGDGTLAGSVLTVPDDLDPRLARWAPAPGGLGHPHRLLNRHLRDAVTALRALGAGALDARIGAIGDRLDDIEPQAGADRPALALLVDRPMALVRARLDLELLGRPAVEQSWTALDRAMAGGPAEPRSDRGFTGVAVRVRLGEAAQLDDGLLGYWIEGPEGIGDSTLHLTETGTDGPACELTLGGPAVTVAMLVDPRAPVHVSCGLLPVATMLVPADHAAAGLRRLAFAFLSAPVLTPEGPLHLPLPHQPGYRWVWRERAGHAWRRVADEDLVAAVPVPIDQRQVLREGWLCLEPNGSP